MMNATLTRGLFCGLSLFCGSAVLTGCSLISDLWNQDSIAQYGEVTFRKQNLVTSQVMMLLEDSDLSPENAKKLHTAEAKMQTECKLLNESATREMDKIASDLTFQKQVRDSISGCDASIQSIQSLLRQLGIKN